MAFAIIRTGGRQHRVSEGDIIDVDFLNEEAGKEGVFADVLFVVDGDTVTGEIVEQRKDKKVIAFKFRRRKGYHRTVGHRRKLTRVKITGISLGGTEKKPARARKTKEESAE
jgi:large subunit ribosomal protein L21